jgi:precorrin-6B methylase 1
MAQEVSKQKVAPPRPPGSLVVVGTGIKAVEHTTAEALACMAGAEKLFYLVAEKVTASWIRTLNPTAEALGDCYAPGKPRLKSYAEMSQRILAAVRAGQRVCVAFYGHPGVFVRPSHDAIRRARREGYPARMLPGISAEDCLFADLGVNPAESGCQSFEAGDFLASRRRFDPSSALILWQVGVLGEPSVRENMTCRPERLKALTARLAKYYAPTHRIVLYQASPFFVCGPSIMRIPLARLPAARIPPMTTLYVPPLPSRLRDSRVARWMRDAPPS